MGLRGRRRPLGCAMLRPVIIFAVIACAVGVFAPSIFPTLLQAMSGAAGASASPPPPLPAIVRAPPPVIQASESEDDGGRVVKINADAGGQYSTEVLVNGSLVHM